MLNRKNGTVLFQETNKRQKIAYRQVLMEHLEEFQKQNHLLRKQRLVMSKVDQQLKARREASVSERSIEIASWIAKGQRIQEQHVGGGNS